MISDNHKCCERKIEMESVLLKERPKMEPGTLEGVRQAHLSSGGLLGGASRPSAQRPWDSRYLSDPSNSSPLRTNIFFSASETASEILNKIAERLNNVIGRRCEQFSN